MALLFFFFVVVVVETRTENGISYSRRIGKIITNSLINKKNYYKINISFLSVVLEGQNMFA